MLPLIVAVMNLTKTEQQGLGGNSCPLCTSCAVLLRSVACPAMQRRCEIHETVFSATWFCLLLLPEDPVLSSDCSIRHRTNDVTSRCKLFPLVYCTNRRDGESAGKLSDAAENGWQGISFLRCWIGVVQLINQS